MLLLFYKTLKRRFSSPLLYRAGAFLCFYGQADYADGVGGNGDDVKGKGDVIGQGKVKDQPEYLCDDQDRLQAPLPFDVQKPGVNAGGKHGQDAQPACAVGVQAQGDENNGKQNFQRDGQLPLCADQVSRNTDGGGHRAGDAAQHQICYSHDAKLNTLYRQNLFPLFQQTDAGHQDRADERQGISDNDSVHFYPPSKKDCLSQAASGSVKLDSAAPQTPISLSVTVNDLRSFLGRLSNHRHK